MPAKSYTDKFLKIIRIATITYLILQFLWLAGVILGTDSGWAILIIIIYLGSLGLIIYGTGKWPSNYRQSRIFMLLGSCLAIVAYIAFVYDLASLQDADFLSYLMNPQWYLIFAAWPTIVLIGLFVFRPPGEISQPEKVGDSK